jgi:hypothetical protein
MMMTCPGRWVPQVSKGKGERAYRFGVPLNGPWAKTQVGPDWFPRALFMFFSSFLLFLFSIYFITISIWFQNDSNKFVNFSKNSKQQIRTVMNMFS